jgi:hypothetical protein
MPNLFEPLTNPEAIKDKDLNWGSPHHSLGKGPTQAAPGNHTHDVTEIDNFPELNGGGSDANFVFTQATMNKTWTISHNLGKRSSVTVEDGSGNTIYGSVKYISDNQVTITFAVAITGKAYFN